MRKSAIFYYFSIYVGNEDMKKYIDYLFVSLIYVLNTFRLDGPNSVLAIEYFTIIIINFNKTSFRFKFLGILRINYFLKVYKNFILLYSHSYLRNNILLTNMYYWNQKSSKLSLLLVLIGYKIEVVLIIKSLYKQIVSFSVVTTFFYVDEFSTALVFVESYLVPYSD